MKTFSELVNELTEALKRKVVYRGGVKKIIKKSTKDGYKNVGGKEVKMKSKELRSRSKAAKRVQKTLKSKQGMMAKKRAKSMRKRGDR